LHLHVAQQHALLFAVDAHAQDGSVKGFLFELVEQPVVVELHVLRGFFSTVDDSRHSARYAEAAARTRSLQRAGHRSDFYRCHVALLNVRRRPRPVAACSKRGGIAATPLKIIP